MIEVMQRNVRRAHVIWITDDKGRGVSPTVPPVGAAVPSRNRRQKKRESRGSQIPRPSYSNISWGGFQKLTIVAGTHAPFHRLLQPISYPGRLWNIESVVAAVAESAQRPQVTFRREARGSGTVGFVFHRSPCGMRHHCLFKMECFVRHSTSLPGRDRFLSLYCSRHFPFAELRLA
jgi:hypothetical protein